MTHVIMLSVLGVGVYNRATFPLYVTTSVINIADFLQRLDAIVLLTLIIGVFFKMTMYSYAAMALLRFLMTLVHFQLIRTNCITHDD